MIQPMYRLSTSPINLLVLLVFQSVGIANEDNSQISKSSGLEWHSLMQPMPLVLQLLCIFMLQLILNWYTLLSPRGWFGLTWYGGEKCHMKTPQTVFRKCGWPNHQIHNGVGFSQLPELESRITPVMEQNQALNQNHLHGPAYSAARRTW